MLAHLKIYRPRGRLPEKKLLFFWILSKRGGGGPYPNFVTPFQDKICFIHFLDALASLDSKLSVSQSVIDVFRLAHLRVFQSYFVCLYFFVNVYILNILFILSILYIPIEETNGVSSKQSPQNPWA